LVVGKGKGQRRFSEGAVSGKIVAELGPELLDADLQLARANEDRMDVFATARKQIQADLRFMFSTRTP
jgi:hypothetical protein